MGCSRPFLRLGILLFSLGGSWCFLRLEIVIVFLGFLKVFRNFNVGVWSVSCVIGLGSLLRAFLLLFLPTARSVVGLGWSRFVCLFAFRPSRRPPHSVRGHGLGIRDPKQRNGTVGLSCLFFLSSCRRPPQLRAGGRARNLTCLLYTSPSPRDLSTSRMPSSA